MESSTMSSVNSSINVPISNSNSNNNNNNNNNINSSGLGAFNTQTTGQSAQQQQQQQQSQQQQAHQPQYSIPGILHYLQYEWQRFELERQQWDIERAELQARIALLQGERKGQENLKNDLVRRIKMLEYCLRQERAKYHKLQYGVDPPPLGNDESQQFNSEPLLDEGSLNNDIGTGTGSGGVNWKHGRQLLRQYLQEIGYTDTIIDVRSSRVRSLLGLSNATSTEDGLNDQLMKGGGNAPSQAKQPRRQQQNSQSPASQLVTDAEASVIATFGFLNEQSRDNNRGVNDGNEEDDDVEEDEDEIGEDGDQTGRPSFHIDSETEEVLSEFDFLSAHQSQEHNDRQGWRGGGNKCDLVDIGELAALTVNNEALDTTSSTSVLQNSLNTEYRKTWNPRYILKSHFDCIHCLRFHSTEPLLVTASADETLKLWNLNKTQPQSNKGKQVSNYTATTFDLEPVYTFRGHTSRVLCIQLLNNTIYSGAQNGELFIWSIPSNVANIDPFEAYDASIFVGSLNGHTDAVWSLCIVSSTNNANSSSLLCSLSSDLTVKVWDTVRHQCVKSINLEEAYPTCIVSIPSHNNSSTSNSATSVAISFTGGLIHIYDLESNSNQPILKFDTRESSFINSIVVHPTMPVIVSAHEDRQIKFWDLNTGKCRSAMVAHLDEVTCLAFDPNGLYLLSGSHDCSIRLWNFDTRTCVQEITSHRKKFDESILDVTFHPTKPFFASAGADALAKVFV